MSELQECKLACRAGSIEGVAHRFEFNRGDLSFWFARIDFETFPLGEQFEISFEDGTSSEAMKVGGGLDIREGIPFMRVDVVGIAPLTATP